LALQGQGQLNQSALAGLLQHCGLNNKCQFQAISLKSYNTKYYLTPYSCAFPEKLLVAQLLNELTRYRMQQFITIHCQTLARTLSQMNSLNIRFFKHTEYICISLPSHFSVDKFHLQIHLCTAHYFIW
jgi:hypothetical protein